MSLSERWRWWIEEPQNPRRAELLRIAMPLVILGFMSARIAHVGDWIGDEGFRVPDLGGDWSQPLYVPPLPMWAAYLVVTTMMASAACVVVGFKTRPAALVCAATLAFVALSDRLAAYSVSKLSPTLMLVIAASTAGTHFSIDAYRKRKRTSKKKKKTKPASWPPGGAIRFAQALPLVIYSASGIAKMRGDWLKDPLVLWTQIHGNYQTWLAFRLASALPAWAWTAMQGTTLAFETLAPLWFLIRPTRRFALLYGLAMHAMIAMLFGPVVWFSLLMMVLLLVGYAPDRFFDLPDRLTT
jgi:uncharacterized membrane protein YphA (DoxX/SURF4 family)